MAISDTVAVLSETAIFRQVPSAQVRVVAMAGRTLSFRGGERIFEQGDSGDAAYILLSGSVSVIARTDEGQETEVARLGQAEVFGEIALILDQPRTTAIEALEESQVLCLERAVFVNLLREFPEIAMALLRVLGQRLERTTRELADARADG